MPIGGQNVPIDAAPEPIKLDQVSIDNAIANLIQAEEQNKKSDQSTEKKLDADDDTEITTKPQPAAEDEPTVNGALETKTYTLKKKTDNKCRSFKCSECKEVRRSVKELNIHHKESHNTQICGRSFKLASTLTRHMYDHNSKIYQCDYSCYFESELQTHRIVHRKNPSFQCMKANCGKWFRRNWDLTLHLQKHDRLRHNCDYEGCTFSTATKKQLKEHQKSHINDYSHMCMVCGKGFHYRSGLKRSSL